LGFPHGKPFRKTLDILNDIIAAGVKLPLIAAGGIFTGADIVEMLRNGSGGGANGNAFCLNPRM